ncbi:MAG: hypothetical protein DM484_19910 [Candidatus Methylumidiphilus alinenensis]|uniref:Uncharacterized protein n=1 Tax=Candidatus Methylumidiphilus alinenensis TaxID=2202197 RepID=A0A2W4QU54_9GAMM|nr:MAG: hypothetical protein DM484_19910 [Candidatus Methylumidiphilus alinenensis]
MKKQHIKLKFVNLTVLVLALGMTACGSVPTKTFAKDKTFVKDFDANYVMKPIPGRSPTMPDSAWLSSHLRAFNPLPDPFEALFTNRLWESCTLAPAPDGDTAGAAYTLINDDYRINASVRFKPAEDMFRLSIHIHVEGDSIVASNNYFYGFNNTPKFRVNNALEHLLTSLAHDYEVYEEDLNGYRISEKDTFIDRGSFAKLSSYKSP